MLFRRFSWADTDTLRTLYLTCVHPNLEYASQLWDPYTVNDINLLESVQKFAMRVCCKRWDLSYEDMLQQLNIPPLTTRRKYLKLTTLFNIQNGTSYFRPGIFTHSTYPHSLRSRICNLTRPLTRTNYFHNSFVPSTISLWNKLPPNVKTIHSISNFKFALCRYFSQAHDPY